jgi:two-component system response regulator HydG
MADSVLVIDDDSGVLRYLTKLLERAGYEVFGAKTGKDGIAAYGEQLPDVVVLDLELPDISGLEALEQLSARGAAVIMLTGTADIEDAVTAMQNGAEGFLTKPIEGPHLLASVGKAADNVRSRRQLQHLYDSGSEEFSLKSLGTGKSMRELARQIDLVAQSDRAKVLLTGESGTGKGWVARIIHQKSSRAAGAFVSINCAGLTSTFLNDELFGHERGAFTDAKEMKRGLVEIAEKGTLFLDEIGDLSPEIQPKLLDVLETQRFRRIGGTREHRSDVRLIAATNKDLARLVEEGLFREDLYYRLSVVPVHIPPVRERTRDDRILLLNRLLADLSKELPDAPTQITPMAMERLVDYHWPGNVRAMKNALERALILSRGRKEIGLEHFPLEILAPAAHPSKGAKARSLADVEQAHIESTLLANRGNRSRTARELGIGRATLLRKIQQYGIDAEPG